MWIQRVTVAHWRGLDFTLDGLEPGLNLIAGPNESGKSRLVEALRFALFESTSGKAAHKKDLETWGVAPEKPRVTVDFELGGTRWHLEKVFLGSGCNTRLRGGGEERSGEDAEERLSELLGVSGGSGRTEVKVQDQGIWSLLWVDQGESRAQPAHNADAQNHILSRLTDEIGEVAAGESGKRLLAQAEAERNRYYTARTGAEKDTLTIPRGKARALEQTLADAVARRDAVAQAADDLEAVRNRIADLEVRHQEAQARRQAAKAKHDEAESLRRDLALASEQVRGAEQARLQAEQRLADRNREQEELAGLAQAVEAAGREVEQAQAALAQAQASDGSARHEYEAQQQRLESLDQRIRTLRRQEVLARQRRDLDGVAERVGRVRKLVEAQTAAREALARLPEIGTEEVKCLREAVEAQRTAEATLQGAAVSVEITAVRTVVVEDEPLTAGESRRFTIDQDSTLNLEDLATIQVKPGGGEIRKLRDAAQEARQHHRRLLQTLGVTSLEAAEQTARQRQAHEADLKRAGEALEQSAPEGLPALEQLEVELKAAVDAAAGQLADAEPFDPELLSRTEAEYEGLSKSTHQARVQREAALERLNQIEKSLAAATSRRDSFVDQRDKLETRLAGLTGLEELRANLETADRAYRERVVARDAIRARYDATGGDALTEDLARAIKAEDQLSAQLTEQHEQRIRLEESLKNSSDDARHERVLDLEAELSEARDELARVERQAAAALRLFEVLNAEYRAARERLIQPVIQRIGPYLDKLFPGSEVWLDEELKLQGLRAESGQQAFEFLSGGAREQLSLLVRIGLAEVVGVGEPWPLVLDDVLVNTDADRIQQMQRVLYLAGQKMQILLFTCHGPMFDTLGPDRLIHLPGDARHREDRISYVGDASGGYSAA